jgi:DNA adenine methylase
MEEQTTQEEKLIPGVDIPYPIPTGSPELEPFIKIPGGKRKLVDSLLSFFPEDFFSSEYIYVEPFLGGGALALKVASLLLQNGTSAEEVKQRILTNELNPQLVNLWNHVGDPDTLGNFQRLAEEHSEDNFYNVREQLLPISNYPLPQYKESGEAAKFLYLDKHCFNGLIRYNKQGIFNSPVGRYSKPQLVDMENMWRIAGLELCVEENDFYTFVEGLMRGGDLSERTIVYFDPPYVPLNITSSFTDYTSQGFNEDDQLRLRGLMDRLTRINVKVILSNSDTEWVRREYSKYNIHEVKAGRSINSVGTKRGGINELIITNFTL